MAENIISRRPGKVDIAIITILEDEFTSVREHFQIKRQRIPDGRTYLIGKVKTHRKQTYSIAIARCSDQGTNASQRLTHDIIHDLDPQLILVVGIAGGIPHEKFTLGDVVVSTHIVNPNVDAWHADGTTDYTTRGGPPHPLVEDIISILPGEPLLAGWTDSVKCERPDQAPEQSDIGGDDEWRERIRKSLDWHFGEEENRSRSPKYIIGPIISSNHLIKDPFRLRDFLKINRSVLAVEMEAAGVYEAAQGIHHQYPVMAIRGISDIIGLQRDTQWRDYACQTAAAFAHAFIMTAPIDARKKPDIPQSEHPRSKPNHSQPKVRNAKDTAGNLRHDWGEAPEVNIFFGRTKELEMLEQWILEDHCRLVAIVGMRGIGKTRLSVKLGKGGIGKTDLSLKLARGIQDQFEYVIWQRLLNAPKITDVLANLIKFLSDQQEIELPESVDDQISRLLFYLQEHCCLLIFDNAETLLEGGKLAGQYRDGYEKYGHLFRQIAEVSHQSCLLLTSREKPQDIALLEGKTRPVRSLELGGLDYENSKNIFATYGEFQGSEEDWQELTEFYNGNPLALELAAKHIQNVFSSDIAAFLKERKPIFSDLRELLDWHFTRLNNFEKEVMYWLAINREPISHPH
jgi:nucleoside phosphorylase